MGSTCKELAGRAQCPGMAGESAWDVKLKDATIRRGQILKQDGDGIGSA